MGSLKLPCSTAGPCSFRQRTFPETFVRSSLALSRSRCNRTLSSVSLRPQAMNIKTWNTNEDGVFSEQALRRKLHEEGYQTVRYVFSPGTVFDYHSHSLSKKDSIASGQFLFRMNGQEVVLQPGDMLDVPAGMEHYAEVVGTEPVIFFDATKL